jgi:hypothetical protein
VPPGHLTLTCELASPVPPEPRNYAEPRDILAELWTSTDSVGRSAVVRHYDSRALGFGTKGAAALTMANSVDLANVDANDGLDEGSGFALARPGHLAQLAYEPETVSRLPPPCVAYVRGVREVLGNVMS